MNYQRLLHNKINEADENSQEQRILEIKQLYKLMPSTRWIDAAVILVIAGLLIRHIEFKQLSLWYFMMIILITIRINIYEKFESTELNNENVNKWFDLYLIATTLYGAMWSITAILLVPSYNPLVAALTIIVLSALTALVSTLSAINFSFLVIYVVTTMWPYSFFLLATENFQHIVIGIAALFTSIIILFMGVRVNSFYKESVDEKLKDVKFKEKLQMI